MRVKTGLAVGMLVALLGALGCYPKTCAPNDTSCWPCPQAGTTNPACAPPWTPIPIEAKPDAGVTK